MEGYLGESELKIENSNFKDFGPMQWALYYIETYGGYDGAHHKDWVLDQVARVLHGTIPNLVIARWESSTVINNDIKLPEGIKELKGEKTFIEEVRVKEGTPTESYKKWVIEYEYGEDGPNTYSYEIGIAP